MITENRYKELTNHSTPNSVSMYMSTQRAGDIEKSRIEFKNLISRVKQELETVGMNPPEIEKLLAPANELYDDQPVWSDMSDGLAVFIAPGRFDYFQVPVSFKPFVHVGDRFHMYQLLEGIEGKGLFYLLALSQNEVRFFECRNHSITPIKISDKVPSSREAALALDKESTLQGHSSGTVIYHGQGNGRDEDEMRIEQFLQQVNTGITDIIPEPDGPLVVASDDTLFATYSKINTYPKLYEKNVSGNPENTDPVFLHEKAVNVLEDWYAKDLRKDAKRFEEALSKQEASYSIHVIVPAAVGGRIDTLFVVRGQHAWGLYDEQTHAITVHSKRQPDSICLIDFAVRHAYENGARIYLLDRTEMPRPTANLNMIVRY